MFYYKFEIFEPWETPHITRYFTHTVKYTENELYALIGDIMQPYMKSTKDTEELMKKYVFKELINNYGFKEVNMDATFSLHSSDIYTIFKEFKGSDHEYNIMCIHAGCNDDYLIEQNKKSIDDFIGELTKIRNLNLDCTERTKEYMDKLNKINW